MDLKGIKKFIIASANFFALKGQGGCEVAANIFHGFDCTCLLSSSSSTYHPMKIGVFDSSYKKPVRL